MGIVIKRMETEEETRGKAYVHWQSWHEAYPGLVSPEYLEKLTLEKCEQMAFTWPQNTVIAVDDGRVVGFVCWGNRGEESPETGEIIAIYILAEYYGTGLGRQLMEHILGFARQELAPIELYLTSRPSREKANLLYQSLGFHRHETNVYKLPL